MSTATQDDVSMAEPSSPAATPAVHPSSSLLDRLPSSLLVHLSQFLSLREKLGQWSCLSRRAASALESRSFVHDSLAFNAEALRAWRASPELQRLLSCVGAVLVQDCPGREASEDAPPSLLASLLPPCAPSLPSSFPGTRHLLLDELVGDAVHAALPPIAQHQRGLESLRLHWRELCAAYRPLSRASLSPQSELRALRHLVLQDYSDDHDLQYSAFRLLCSLPLTHFGVSAVAPPTAAERKEAAATQPVTDSWQWLRLPFTWSPWFKSTELAEELDALLDGYGANEGQRRAPPQAGLQFLSQDSGGDWPHRAARLGALAWSLVSLELRALPSDFDPLLLLDAATGQPLLPRVQYLSLGEHTLDATVEEANKRRDAICRLLRAYSSQLRCLSLFSFVGSSCWPLLEAVFTCRQLRRLEVVMSLHLQIPDGQQDINATLAALRPLTDPPPLPPLLHLHSLTLKLPLSPLELQRVLESSPALHHLYLGDLHSLDAQRFVRHLAQHVSRGLRSLFIAPALPLTAKSKRPTQLSSSSRPLPFPALTTFVCSGSHTSWTAPKLQQLVELLQSAPLRQLSLQRLSPSLVHILAPLSLLQSLTTSAVPAECRRFFQEHTPEDSAAPLEGYQAGLRRRLLQERTEEPHIDDEAELSEEELLARLHHRQHHSPRRFLRQRLFDGRDGREDYMHHLQRVAARG